MVHGGTEEITVILRCCKLIGRRKVERKRGGKRYLPSLHEIERPYMLYNQCSRNVCDEAESV